MQPSSTSIQHFLSAVDKLAAHQAEITRLKGEGFNLFSILGMESAENKTHSAFLGELLNPKGSHGMGNVFLQLFLDEIHCEEHLDITSTISVILEYHIDWTDYDKETGGRIDIYIQDAVGKSISIENKIYAGDQHRQIARYVNHNKNSNRVFYLTLDGGDASEESRGDLNKENKDYHCISYRDTITDWLGKCMKEAADLPILRESVKQYIILIQKLTGQLSDTKMEKEIHQLIINNYREAQLIQQNFWVAMAERVHEFLTEVKSQIESKLPPEDGWQTTIDANLWESYRGINIDRADWKEIRLGLKGNSKIIGDQSFYGIYAPKNIWDRSSISNNLSPLNHLLVGSRKDHWWPYFQCIDLFNGEEGIARMCEKKDWGKLVSDVASILIELAETCKEPLAKATKVHENTEIS